MEQKERSEARVTQDEGRWERERELERELELEANANVNVLRVVLPSSTAALDLDGVLASCSIDMDPCSESGGMAAWKSSPTRELSCFIGEVRSKFFWLPPLMVREREPRPECERSSSPSSSSSSAWLAV